MVSLWLLNESGGEEKNLQSDQSSLTYQHIKMLDSKRFSVHHETMTAPKSLINRKYVIQK